MGKIALHNRILTFFFSLYFLTNLMAFEKGNTPHSAYGLITFENSTLPDTLQFMALITSRPSEKLYQYSVGCGYDKITGIWYVNCANFRSSWNIGDTLSVSFSTLDNTNNASVKVALTGAPADSAVKTCLMTPRVKVGFASNPAGITLNVDGIDISAPYYFNWEAGSFHQIKVDSLQYKGSSTRYGFLSWNQQEKREFTFKVPEYNTTLSVNFSTEFYLEIDSEYGDPFGQGWYVSSTIASFGVSVIDTISNGSRAVFIDWHGSGNGSYSGSLGQTTVVMSEGIKQTANWQKQHQLLVKIVPVPGGAVVLSPLASDNWYRENTSIDLRAVPHSANSYEFTHWDGDILGQINPRTIQMDQSKSIEAHFTNSDSIAVRLASIFPTGEGTAIPYNAPLLFTIEEPSPGTGIDTSSIILIVNNDTLITPAHIEAGIAIYTDSKKQFALIHSTSKQYKINSINTIRIICDDYSDKSSRLDTTITFFSTAVQVFDMSHKSVNAQGGNISSSDGKTSITVAAGIFSRQRIFTLGTIANPPQAPESASLLGKTYYLGPDCQFFKDSLIMSLTFDQEIITRSGVTHPLQIPIYHFSTKDGRWRQCHSYRSTNNKVYLKIPASGFFCFGNNNLTSISTAENNPAKMDLQQNYPNPFNSTTKICYSIPESGKVSIKIIDIQGRIVKTIDFEQRGGYHEINWTGEDNHGQNVASGIYFYFLKWRDQRIIKKMTLVQ